MDNKVLIGVAKLLEKKAKAARDKVKPGEYEIDEEVILHILGTLNVNEDTAYIPTSSIPYKTVLALFARYCGITRETALQHLENAMHQALSLGDDAAELIKAVADLDAAEARVQATLEALPKVVRRGAVSVAELECAEIRPAKNHKKAA